MDMTFRGTTFWLYTKSHPSLEGRLLKQDLKRDLGLVEACSADEAELIIALGRGLAHFDFSITDRHLYLIILPDRREVEDLNLVTPDNVLYTSDNLAWSDLCSFLERKQGWLLDPPLSAKGSNH